MCLSWLPSQPFYIVWGKTQTLTVNWSSRCGVLGFLLASGTGWLDCNVCAADVECFLHFNGGLMSVSVSPDERMLQGPEYGLSPTWTPNPVLVPLSLTAPPSHHAPAVPRAPEAAGGVTDCHRPSHLALPAGRKPGEWVRVRAVTKFL